jgi:hypothetical protein
MIQEVRSLLGELNSDSINDVRDILPALNRAQDRAANSLARMYQSPLLSSILLEVGEDGTLPIPEDALEQRIERVELEYQAGYFVPLTYVAATEISNLETKSVTTYPSHYTTFGLDFRILPNPQTGTRIRVWYAKEPPPLTLPAGTVLRTPAPGDTWVLLDSIGEGLEAMSYCSVIDGKTGKIKGSFQIQKLQGQRVYLQPSPSRAEVKGQIITNSLLPLSIKPDDFLTPVGTSCISIMRKPLYSFLIQAAVADITRKLGGQVDWEEKILQDLERTVERSWSGREGSPKIRKTNPHWGRR